MSEGLLGGVGKTVESLTGTVTGTLTGLVGAVVSTTGAIVDSSGKKIGELVQGDPQQCKDGTVQQEGSITDSSGDKIFRPSCRAKGNEADRDRIDGMTT